MASRQWTAQDIENIRLNPIYVGMGPYPATVSEELWIAGTLLDIQRKGAVYTIRRIFELWGETFGLATNAQDYADYVDKVKQEPEAALRQLLADLRQRCERVKLR